MATIEELKARFSALVNSLEKKPERVLCIAGDGNGNLYANAEATTTPNKYVHVRLDDGSYYGTALHVGQFPIAYDGKVICGYTHAQPEVFQTIELRETVGAGGVVLPPVQMPDVQIVAGYFTRYDLSLIFARSRRDVSQFQDRGR
jgi:hypothetical protein